MAAGDGFICVHLAFILVFLSFGSASYVAELDERFTQARSEGNWLVEFYAPWCGYCKKLEPIFEEVAKTLYGSGINVAKIDATVYSAISREYGVRGFPSIKFIKGDLVITYEGERTAQDIVQFAQKASGPAVKELKSGEELRKVQRDRTVFFLMVLKNGDVNHLKTLYSSAAEKRITEAHFFSIEESNLPKGIKIEAPVIAVFKDGKHFIYDIPPDVTAGNISDWVSKERFGSFVHITRTNMHEIADTGRSIAFVVFAENREKNKINERIGKIMKSTALGFRDEFHSSLQFGWTLGDSIATNIMMSTATAPFIMVYNTTTFVYHLKYYNDIKDSFAEEDLVEFLENVLAGKETGYGGDSIIQRIIRGLYSFWTTIYEVWTEQPVAASLMFGLPMLVFSFIIYMLCTVEGGDGDEDEYPLEDDYDGEFEPLEGEDGDEIEESRQEEKQQEDASLAAAAQLGGKPKTE